MTSDLLRLSAAVYARAQLVHLKKLSKEQYLLERYIPLRKYNESSFSFLIRILD
jgi:hypothetical protein